METLLNPRANTLPNPASVYLRWSGGAEKVKIAGKEDEYDYEGGYLFYKDKDNDYEKVKLDLPFMMYPLGESYQIEGGVFEAPQSPNNTMISSSEFGGWDETMTVYERGAGDDRGAPIARGTWDVIKDTVKAHKGKVRTNLYGLAEINGERVIVRLEAAGAASRALSDFRRKMGAEFYSAPLIIDGAEYKTNGTVTYASPKFVSGEPYDENAQKGLQEYAKTLSEYGNALRERNLKNGEQESITDATSDEDYQRIVNQEPSEPTEAEASQENKVDLTDVPF